MPSYCRPSLLLRRLVSVLLAAAAVLPGLAGAQTRTPEQVPLPPGMTGTVIVRLDRLQSHAPPAARASILSSSGLAVWLLQTCGISVQEAVSITIGTAGDGETRAPFYLVSARAELDLAACARVTGAQVESGKALGSWPGVLLKRSNHPPLLLAKVSGRSVVAMNLPPADEAWLRGAVERVAAASRVREAVAAEAECVVYVRCAEAAEVPFLFPAQTPFATLLRGAGGLSGRVTIGAERWKVDLKTICADRPAALAAAERWKRWCGIALPDADTEVNDSGALCDIILEMPGSDLPGLLAELPPESRSDAVPADPAQAAGTIPAEAMPPEAKPAEPAETAEAKPPAAVPPEPAEPAPAPVVSGPEPDQPPLAGAEENAARRRAQSIAAAFNGGAASGGFDPSRVSSLSEALTLMRTGVHGAGRHSGLLFQVNTTEAEARDAARYLRLEGGVLRYLIPAAR